MLSFLRKMRPAHVAGTLTVTSAGFHAYTRYHQHQEMTGRLSSHFERKGMPLPATPDITKLKEIQPKHMVDGRWQDLQDDQEYTVKIAVKPAFEDQFGKRALAHASIAIEVEDGEYLVVGRQSPALSVKKEKEKKPETLAEKTATIIDNEKNYLMPYVSNFKTLDSEVTLTGAQIKAAIAKTEKEVCEKELCNMLNSNCCTAVVETICNMHREVAKTDGDIQEKISKLVSLDILLFHAQGLNYSQGIANNKITRNSITEITNSSKKEPALKSTVSPSV